MELGQLILYWVIFGISNILLGLSVMMLTKGGPFARLRVPPAVATFLFICGMTALLFGGKQNLLQSTINFFLQG